MVSFKLKKLKYMKTIIQNFMTFWGIFFMFTMMTHALPESVMVEGQTLIISGANGKLSIKAGKGSQGSVLAW
jgi:hypothetical protein